MIFKKMEIKDFNKVIKIIEELDSVKLNYSISPYGNTLNLSSSDNISELYIKKSLDKLIISRVQFKNTRTGIMTEVLKELINITKAYKYDKIVVESVLSKEMSEFCIKNKFKQVPNYYGEYDGYMGDYELNLY